MMRLIATRVCVLLALVLAACSDDAAALGPDAALPDAAIADAVPADAAVCPPILGLPAPPPECPAHVYSCAIGDGGWRAQCLDGHILTDGATDYYYCECGRTEYACQLSIGGPRDLLTCPGACLDTDLHYFDTFGEFSSFRPESLCAP